MTKEDLKITEEDLKITEEALQTLEDNLSKIAKIIAELTPLLLSSLRQAFDNKQVVHLARYGSTQRIREKNKRRLRKIAERWLKNDKG